MNIEALVSFPIMISSRQWDSWVIWQFYSQFFKEFPYFFLQWLYQFKFLPTVQEGSLFSTSSPVFIVYRHFNNGHSDWCEMRPYCSFDLHPSNNEQCSASFQVFISHLHVFFGEMSVQVFCPTFEWVVVPNSFQEATITLIAKPDKNTTKKKIAR